MLLALACTPADAHRAPRTRRGTVLCVTLAVLYLSLAGRSCLADLRVDAASPHASLWYKLYAALPNAWKSSSRVDVHEVTPAQMRQIVALNEGEAQSMDDGADIDGCFQTHAHHPLADATITLRDDLTASGSDQVFLHEYGHFVWDVLMTRRQRIAYSKIWRAQRRAGHLVTEYSRDSDAEGFAEAFSYFVLHMPGLRVRDERSYEFLQRLEEAFAGERRDIDGKTTSAQR
jgi:hypothetical protein